MRLAETVLRVDLDSISIIPYIKNISVPILFIFGSHDKFLNEQEIYKIWNDATSTFKFALIAPFEHTRSYLKCKELYYELRNKFIISNSPNMFLNYLKDLYKK